MVISSKDGAPFEVDLTEFSEGSQEHGTAPRSSLITELAPAIRLLLHGKTKASRAEMVSNLRLLWRILDGFKPMGLDDITSVREFSSAHGAILRRHILGLSKSAGYSRKLQSSLYQIVALAREVLDSTLPEILWPRIRSGRGTTHNDVDPKFLKALYHHAKRLHAGFLSGAAEASQLIKAGVDPRFATKNRNTVWLSSANWAVFSQAYVTASLSQGSLPMKTFAKRATPLRNARWDLQPGPSFLPESTRTSLDTVRWWVPTVEDAVAAFTLVQTHFGWNPETTKAIDITEPDCWCNDRLDHDADNNSKTSTVAIYALKGRSGEQMGFSLRAPSSHPYQVILAMIKRTEPLRSVLRDRIRELEQRESRSLDEEAQIAELKTMCKSPWLYFAFMIQSNGTRVGVISKSGNNSVLRRLMKEAVQANRRMLKGIPQEAIDLFLKEFTFSDIRDGFASLLYDNSMYNIFILKAALGHGNVSATYHYIRQRQQIANRFRRFTDFQEVFFDSVARLKNIDPTIIFARLNNIELGEEQIRALLDYRQRTRMGMGCFDPKNPPADIAPGHNGGVCAVQRCTLCIHGVVFNDSLSDLAVRAAELEFIRKRTAMDRFHGSTFHEEWLAIHVIVEFTLSERLGEFRELSQKHLQKLENGGAYLFDQIPPDMRWDEQP